MMILLNRLSSFKNFKSTKLKPNTLLFYSINRNFHTKTTEKTLAKNFEPKKNLSEKIFPKTNLTKDKEDKKYKIKNFNPNDTRIYRIKKEVDNYAEFLVENYAKTGKGALQKVFEGTVNLFDLTVRCLWLAIFIYIIYQLTSANKASSEESPKSMMFEDMFAGPQEPMENPTTKFSDVVGQNDVRKELEQVCDIIKNRQKYLNMGADPPKGVLLSGPPGVGKTLLGRALAGEIGVPFYFISASNIDGMIVGSGVRKIKKIFQAARKHEDGAIIFIDEIDAIGVKRSKKAASSSPYSRMTINKLLNELDGFETDDKIIVIASTNMPDVLDPALTRSGRFDVHVQVPVPAKGDRLELLEYYLDKVAASPDIDVKKLSEITGGLVGADFKNLVNLAAHNTTRLNKDEVDDIDMEYALKRLHLGIEQKTRFKAVTQFDKTLVAFREAGKIVVNLKLDSKYKVLNTTIIPRNGILGKTRIKSLEYSDNGNKADFLDQITFLLCGKLAEEYISEKFFGEKNPSTEDNNDYSQVKKIATNMVKKLGMGEGENKFMFHVHDDSSEYLKQQVEKESQRIIQNCLQKAKEIFKSNIRDVELLANSLLYYESLTGEEIVKILKTKDVKVVHKDRKKIRDVWNQRAAERREAQFVDIDKKS